MAASIAALSAFLKQKSDFYRYPALLGASIMLVNEAVRRSCLFCPAQGVDVIDAVLMQMAAQLNQHFRRHYPLVEDVVVVSNLQDVQGGQIDSAENKLVIFLSSIERDTAAHRSGTVGRAMQPGIAGTLRGTEPVYLNLLVMCAANFNGPRYPEALKFLSSAIAFFQSRPIFDRHNTLEMDTRIERFVLNIENLDTNQMHSLWSIHGSHYLPSVLYRVRLVNLDGDSVMGRDPSIRDLDVGVSS